jgi:ribosome modulation factor
MEKKRSRSHENLPYRSKQQRKEELVSWLPTAGVF